MRRAVCAGSERLFCAVQTAQCLQTVDALVPACASKTKVVPASRIFGLFVEMPRGFE
jgi:hypothetical protein